MSSIRNCLVAALIAIVGICTSDVSEQGSVQIPDNIQKHIPAEAFLLVYTLAGQARRLSREDRLDCRSDHGHAGQDDAHDDGNEHLQV